MVEVSPGVVAAAVLAGVGAALSLPPRARLPRGEDSSTEWRWQGGLVLAFALPATLAVAALDGARLALVLIVGGVLLAGSAVVRRQAALRRAEQRRDAVVTYGEALLGELRAGQPVLRALDRAVRSWPETAPVAAAGRLGGDVPGAFRRLARRPGAESLVRLAAAWELCATTGSGLAFALEQLLETARAEQAVTRAVKGELASVRATARLVALLPVVVLVGAESVGAQPWRFLLEGAPGLTCLAVGCALALGGTAWIDRIAAEATRGDA